MPLKELQGRVAVAGPFDLELSARLLCAPPRAGRDWSAAGDYWHGREYRRVVWWTGQPALLRLSNRGSIDNPNLGWRLTGASRDSDYAPHTVTGVASRVRAMVSADTDLAACYASFRGDPVLEPLTQRFCGLRVLRFPSLYECLVATILEQQLNFWFAAQVKRQLYTAFGPEVEFEGHRYRGVPAPAVLAGLTPEALRPLQVSAPKARALAAMARAALAGELHPPSEHDAEAVIEHLMRLRGVGRWSAAYARLRGLGHTDALPLQDAGLLRSVTLLYGSRTSLTPQALERKWRRFAPWRGYAAYYIWLTQWTQE